MVVSNPLHNDDSNTSFADNDFHVVTDSTDMHELEMGSISRHDSTRESQAATAGAIIRRLDSAGWTRQSMEAIAEDPAWSMEAITELKAQTEKTRSQKREQLFKVRGGIPRPRLCVAILCLGPNLF